MASYKVVFKPSVEKDLRSLPKSVTARVFKQVEALKDEPFPRQSIKLAGAEQLYRFGIIIRIDVEPGVPHHRPA